MNSARESPGVLLLFTEVFANGGIQRFNQTLLAALAQLNVPCDILSVQDTPASIARHTLDRNVRVSGFGGNRRKFALAAFLAIWRGRHRMVAIGHINLLSMAMLAVACKFWRREKTLLIVHGIEVWYRINPSRRHALRRVSDILCVSQYTRQRILEQVPALDPRRLRIFPNALGESWTRVKNAPLSMRLPERFILSVTRLQKGDRYKGVISVIESLSMLADTSLHYIVVGQGDDLPFLQLVASNHGVRDRVIFLSGINDAELINLYDRCDAFVLPSGKEGFGIVFLEAMFFRAPVIAAAEKGALDVVRDGETGLLVRFGDSIGLARAIERLRADPALCNHLRRVGRATVTGDGAFTFSRFVARTAEVLGTPGARAA